MRTPSQEVLDVSTGNLVIFSKRILEARDRLKMTQAELGEMIGFSGAVIGNYEQGLNFPHIKKLPLLARALGVSQGWLLGDDVLFEAPQNEPLSKKAVDWLFESGDIINEIRSKTLNKSATNSNEFSSKELEKIRKP